MAESPEEASLLAWFLSFRNVLAYFATVFSSALSEKHLWHVMPSRFTVNFNSKGLYNGKQSSRWPKCPGHWA